MNSNKCTNYNYKLEENYLTVLNICDWEKPTQVDKTQLD